MSVIPKKGTECRVAERREEERSVCEGRGGIMSDGTEQELKLFGGLESAQDDMAPVCNSFCLAC